MVGCQLDVAPPFVLRPRAPDDPMSQPPAHTDDDADEAIVTRCLDGAQAASNGGDTEELKAKLSTLALEMKRSSLGIRHELILPRVRDLIESNISRDSVVLACIRVVVAYEAVIRARENPVNNDALDEEIVELVFSSAIGNGDVHEWHDFLPEAPHMASLLTRQLITCSAAGTERIVSLVEAYMRDRETPNMGFIGEAWQAGLFAALFQRVMQDNRHVPDLIFTQPTQMIELLLVPASQPLPLLRACHAPDLLLMNLINASDNVERSYPRESRLFLQILFDDSSSTVTF